MVYYKNEQMKGVMGISRERLTHTEDWLPRMIERQSTLVGMA